MQPGDIYQSPGGHYPPPFHQQQQPPPQQQQQPPRPLGARPQGYASPTRSTPFPPSNTQPDMSGYNPYDNPPPAGAGGMHHSQSQPFPQQHTGGRHSIGGYGDPFNDQHAPGIADGSRHYPSQPNLQSHTPAPYQAPPPHGMTPAPLSPPRTRFDSNVSYHSNQNSYSYGLSDNRLSSPPPLLQQHSSNSSFAPYPPQPNVRPQGGLYGNAQEDDINDSAPLLSHATPDPRFGIPQSASAMSMRPQQSRYQLSDVGAQGPGQGGDIGVVPGGWSSSFNGPGDDEDVNVHYGPVPNRVLRRNRTQKKIK